ncbi:MAG: helix-turn-helix transcriptional regulator [Thermonemataceae bacterium]
MKTKLHNIDLEELFIEAEYPQGFHDSTHDIVERVFSADVFLGMGFYRELFFEGIHIGYGDIKLANDTQIRFESDFETVEMHFTLNGHTRTSDSPFHQEVQFRTNEHNIFYTKGFEGNTHWQANTETIIFEVNLLPSFFNKYFPALLLPFRKFAKRIAKEESTSLQSQNLPITPAMHLLIQEIIHCDRVGVFKKIFLESKVIELLLLQLEQIQHYEKASVPKLKKVDIEKMHAAKEIILHNLRTPTSLKELAKDVGTNEFTLKKGFKALFGNTVFGFWNEVRMKEAKYLLLEGEKSVAEVASLVGYKNPQHFTAAFKRQFGVVPSKLR